MSQIIEKLTLYWAYPFVRYALVVGVLIALCSSLLGVTLVLKRFSFIGDGLSHVAFGALAIASVLDIPAAGFPYASVMPYLYENAIKDYLGPICKDYIDYYNYNGWGTISAVDCNQMEGLAEAVRSVILSNQDSLKNVDTADLQQYGKGSSNFKGYAYDMLQFIEKLCGGMAPDDFTQQLKKTVVYTGYTHDPTSSLYRIDGDNYSGMGMYIPNSFTTPKYLLWNNYFKSSIAWYHASGWAETESIWGN